MWHNPEAFIFTKTSSFFGGFTIISSIVKEPSPLAIAALHFKDICKKLVLNCALAYKNKNLERHIIIL